MKKLIFVFFALISISAYSQNLPIKFTANEKTYKTLGEQWDPQYTPLNNKMDVEFDGKVLKMVYETGKEYWITEVADYKVIEKKNLDGDLEKRYILTVIYNGYTQYILIYMNKVYGELKPEILIPGMVDGFVISYTSYQQF